MNLKTLALTIMVCFTGQESRGQTFSLQRQSDSLSLLVLQSESCRDVWRLPYPTYAFATGDVNGDGVTDALVGVVKATRFDPRIARRLFVFQQIHDYVRPLWLGSRLAGELQEFRLEGQHVVTLEQSRDSLWFVGLYHWDSFGFTMTGRRIQDVSREQADSVFRQRPTVTTSEAPHTSPTPLISNR